MSITRFFAIFKARNIEFFRDRASLSWNLIFPILLLIGFAFVFSGDGKALYKIGFIHAPQESVPIEDIKYLEFVRYDNTENALRKLRQHKIDLLMDFNLNIYWINDSSPNGYMAEKLLLSLDAEKTWQKQSVSGRQIRYLDWVLPGILGMNMMFSCLFGVGYVIVRYRKSMVLKRLSATPVNAFEFLLAQVISRLFIVLFISSVIFIGCDWVFDFYMQGSYFDLFVIAILGALSLISLGLLIASRIESEELTGGLLNLVSWPMMILSGVWFSLEGSPDFIQGLSWIFPLTYLVDGARAIMTDGSTLQDLSLHIGVLLFMTTLFITIGALNFRWQGRGR